MRVLCVWCNYWSCHWNVFMSQYYFNNSTRLHGKRPQKIQHSIGSKKIFLHMFVTLQIKCYQYWPCGEAYAHSNQLEFGNFKINYLRELHNEYFTIRSLELENILVSSWSYLHCFLFDYFWSNRHELRQVVIIIFLDRRETSNRAFSLSDMARLWSAYLTCYFPGFPVWSAQGGSDV